VAPNCATRQTQTGSISCHLATATHTAVNSKHSPYLHSFVLCAVVRHVQPICEGVQLNVLRTAPATAHHNPQQPLGGLPLGHLHHSSTFTAALTCTVSYCVPFSKMRSSCVKGCFAQHLKRHTTTLTNSLGCRPATCTTGQCKPQAPTCTVSYCVPFSEMRSS
jgi:hypothetical protein